MYDRDDSRSSGRMDAHGGLARDGTRCPCETTADVLYTHTHTHSVRYLRPDSISRSFGCAAQNIAEQLFLDPVSLFQSYMQWVYIYFDTYIYWAAHQFIKKHLRERGGDRERKRSALSGCHSNRRVENLHHNRLKSEGASGRERQDGRKRKREKPTGQKGF